MSVKWTRLKDGVTLVMNSDETDSDFRITMSGPQGVRLYPLYRLTRDGKQVYESSDKASVKEVALALVAGGKSVFRQVLKTIDKAYKKAFVRFIEASGLKYIPKIDGPKPEFFEKMAKKGEVPRSVSFTPTYLKQGGLEHEKLSDAYLHYLYVKLFPVFYPVQYAADRETERAARKANKLRAEALKENALPSPENASQTEEAYKGPFPKPRSKDGLVAINSVTDETPIPEKPKNAKFSVLRKWSEATRDYYAERKKYPTIEYLLHAALFSFAKHDRGMKAANRLKLIYPDEYRQYQLRLKVASLPKKEVEKEDKPKKEKKEKQSKEKDKWGYRVGSGAAKINAVLTKIPMSAKKIARLSQCERNPSGHLSTLVKKKLAFRTADGKYRLRKKKKRK